MHSDWFNGIEILQGRWQHGEKVGYYYPSGLAKTLCKWDLYAPLVMKGLKQVPILSPWQNKIAGTHSFITGKHDNVPCLHIKTRKKKIY
jgi:hypothetical protein